jgi:hypothetical protein
MSSLPGAGYKIQQQTPLNSQSMIDGEELSLEVCPMSLVGRWLAGEARPSGPKRNDNVAESCLI